MEDGDSFGAGSYPTPLEEEEKHIKAKVYVSFDIECDVPEKWDVDDIYRYLKATYNDYDCQNVKVEDIEL